MQVKDLNPAPYNPRKITDKSQEMLGKSMDEFGDLSGVVYNLRTKRLIGGHMRLKHLNPDWEIDKHPVTDEHGTVAEGVIKTPKGNWFYREVDWPENKEMAANVRANKPAGENDIPMLKDIFVELDTGAFDMDLTGFEQKEITEIFDWEKKEDNKLQDVGFLDDSKSDKKTITLTCYKINEKEIMEEIKKLCGRFEGLNYYV